MARTIGRGTDGSGDAVPRRQPWTAANDGRSRASDNTCTHLGDPAPPPRTRTPCTGPATRARTPEGPQGRLYTLWRNPGTLTAYQTDRLAWTAETDPRLRRAYLPGRAWGTCPRSNAEVSALRCPRCLAKVGDPCGNAEGKPLPGGHSQRRLCAQRAAYRAGERPRMSPAAKPSTPEAAARREDYRRQQASRKSGSPSPKAESSFDDRGRRISSAAEAVSRPGRHRLRVDNGLPAPVRPVRVVPMPAPGRSRPVSPRRVADAPAVPSGPSGLAARLPAPDPAWAVRGCRWSSSRPTCGDKVARKSSVRVTGTRSVIASMPSRVTTARCAVGWGRGMRSK